MAAVCDAIQASWTPTHLVIVPSRSSNSHLAINRRTGEVATADQKALSSYGTEIHKKTFFGLLGMFNVPEAGPVVAFVAKRVRQGEILGGHIIYRLEAAEVIALRSGKECQTSANTLTQMINTVLSTPYFYFSYSLDLTQTRQREFLAKDKEESIKKSSILDQCDQRFVWNYSMLKPFMELPESVSSLVLPIIHGAVFINKLSIHGKSFSWILISRRSRHMVGTRFYARGCDSKGQVANFVETEQIVEYGTSIASFVQTRGSMPMYWDQTPNIRYMPRPKTAPGANHISALMNHFKEQMPIYGHQVIVNLVNHKKAEGELELCLRNLVSEANINGLHYIGFDFHKECSKMRYDRLSLLISKCKDYLSDFEYYCASNGTSVESPPPQLQKGVFRTNCMDCLDRTNVVQSLLATENLKVVLKRFGILTPTDDILQQLGFQHVYKNAWADHADLISVQYAGTGALKTDFTRTGKRTYYGLLQDGWNAANRYFLNNFMDGDRTDALRLVAGEVAPEDALHAKGARAAAGKPVAANLPIALGVCLMALAFALITSNDVSQALLALLAAMALSYVFYQMMLSNAKSIVNFPATKNRLMLSEY